MYGARVYESFTGSGIIESYLQLVRLRLVHRAVLAPSCRPDRTREYGKQRTTPTKRVLNSPR